MIREIMSISFYYPTSNIGGAQLLFSRVAVELYNLGYKIKVYQHGECYISTFLTDYNISFEKLDSPVGGKFSVGKEELFILSMSYGARISNVFNFHDENRFIFWDLNHYCLLNLTKYFPLYKRISNFKIVGDLLALLERTRKRKIISFVDDGVAKQGVFFISGYNLKVNRKIFEFNSTPEILPIPIVVPEEGIANRDKNKPDLLSIGWISRLSHDKTNILRLLLDDVKNFHKPLKVYIIGDGAGLQDLKKYVKRIGLERVIFTGKIENQLLRKFVSENIDIGISVGTAALEFSLAGIPTVLMPNKSDVRFFKRRIKKYGWIYQIVENDVSIDKENPKFHKSLNEIITDYNQYNDLGTKSFEYVYQNHGIVNIIKKLAIHIDRNRYFFSDLKRTGLTETSFFERKYLMRKRSS